MPKRLAVEMRFAMSVMYLAFTALKPAGALTCADLTVGSSVSQRSWGELKAARVASFRAATRKAADTELRIAPLKWLDGHRSAVSITYDGAYYWNRHIARIIQDRGLRMDFEVVTDDHQTVQMLWDSLDEMRALLDQGIRYFGHGHKHDRHDEFDEQYVRQSFQLNFALMKQWGLDPKAYAYPGSAGTKSYVQKANRDAGFICARGDDHLDRGNYYILPDDQTEPASWYFLPSVVMGTTYASMIEDHATLRPILRTNLKRRSWTILMYHAVGNLDGWGYYPIAEFERDLDWLQANDVWVAHLDQCCAYIKEKQALQVSVTPMTQSPLCDSYEVILEDQLAAR